MDSGSDYASGNGGGDAPGHEGCNFLNGADDGDAALSGEGSGYGYGSGNNNGDALSDAGSDCVSGNSEDCTAPRGEGAPREEGSDFLNVNPDGGTPSDEGLVDGEDSDCVSGNAGDCAALSDEGSDFLSMNADGAGVLEEEGSDFLSVNADGGALSDERLLHGEGFDCVAGKELRIAPCEGDSYFRVCRCLRNQHSALYLKRSQMHQPYQKFWALFCARLNAFRASFCVFLVQRQYVKPYLARGA
ncbi:hypothetical protein SLS55_007251 [Diplodia seriata]|uniref:Uncharacterized protein n=1 Tax=Diplodia seriata TaxID=420778 RepID=A0ABR3CBP2_9PEZI